MPNDLHNEQPPTPEEIRRVITYLRDSCNAASTRRGWWHHPPERGGAHLLTNPDYAAYVVATKIALQASEVFEAFEGFRRGEMDDKLPEFPAIVVEQADAMIRMFDLCGELEYDLAGALLKKIEFNVDRKDHDIQIRQQAGGKKF